MTDKNPTDEEKEEKKEEKSVCIKVSASAKSSWKEENNLSNETIKMEFTGTSLNKNDIKVAATAEEAKKILKNFNKDYGEGNGIYFVLASYSLLRDY